VLGAPAHAQRLHPGGPCPARTSLAAAGAPGEKDDNETSATARRFRPPGSARRELKRVGWNGELRSWDWEARVEGGQEEEGDKAVKKMDWRCAAAAAGGRGGVKKEAIFL
jgi:hypothetical protein